MAIFIYNFQSHPLGQYYLYYFSQGITFKDYLDFFCFMRNISEADMALSFHNAAGKPIDPGIQFLTGSELLNIIFIIHVFFLMCLIWTLIVKL